MTLLGILKIAIIFLFVMKLVPILVYIERRLSARIQQRHGPIMVGLPNWEMLGPAKGFHLWGLMQPLADMVKFLFKENFVPATAERTLYQLAPAMVFIPAALALAGIPFADGVTLFQGNGDATGKLVIFNSELGLLFVLAVATLGVHGLSIAGWSSNNKYSQMGGIRASAQLVSYEAPMFIGILAALMTVGTTNFFTMVSDQADNGWLIWRQPLAFIIVLICAFAETNRAPFDMPEAEPELIGGYHTEYGGMRFALFFLGEYIAMFNQCAIIVLLFLGGWTFPYFPGLENLADMHLWLGGWMGAIIFVTKVILLLLFMIHVRWTLPRFRYDQLMTLGWKRLTPLSMANLALTAMIGVLL